MQDFDGDGLTDMVVSDTANGQLLVYLGLPNAEFTAPAAVSAMGQGPRGIGIADLNADGLLDVAVANAASANVSVFLGNGDGTLQNFGSYSAGPGASALAIADLNNDLRQDIVVANAESAFVSILLGNGNGTFPTPVQHSVNGRPSTVALADVNHDGRTDLIAGLDIGAAIEIHLGQGNGTFLSTHRYTQITNVDQIVVGHFNADGHADLAVLLGNANRLQVRLGAGDGSYPLGTEYVTEGQGRSLAVGDFNGDSFSDLAVACVDTHSIVEVFSPTGSGTLTSTFRFQFPTTNPIPIAMSAVDVNSDGRLDLLTANQGEGTVVILLNESEVVVLAQPLGRLVEAGSDFTLSTLASTEVGTAEYQWYRNDVPLIDDGRVSGATTSTLSVADCRMSDTGSYRAVVGSATCPGLQQASTQPAIVAVIGPPVCGGDFNHDGVVDSTDFFEFLTAFFAGCP